MKLPVPQRGQPFDISFVYKITESINALWDKVAINVSSYASLWTREGQKQIRISEAKIVTNQKALTLGSSVKANDEQTFDYTFDLAFRYPPVVTVSVILNGSVTASNKNAYAVITSVSTNTVEGFVIFEKGGDVSGVSVNIIAVGLPV
jgi:hypothetical protein